MTTTMTPTTRRPAAVPARFDPAGQPGRQWRRRFAAVLFAGLLTSGAVAGAAVPASADTSAERTSTSAAAARTVMSCASAAPTLRQGSRHSCVAPLQHFLRSIAYISGVSGFNPGPIDGIFGPRTRDAVKLFQGYSGISRDGVVGRVTWAHIEQDCNIFYHRHGADFCRKAV